MNDGNIEFYLRNEMQTITDHIRTYEAYVKSNEEAIDDHLKMIKNLKVHYISLLNTAIAYGYEVEEE